MYCSLFPRFWMDEERIGCVVVSLCRLRLGFLGVKNHNRIVISCNPLLCRVCEVSRCNSVSESAAKMEKMFGPAYTGDPGVPHSDKEAFSSIFWGSVAFSAYSIACPYYWEQCTNMFNWHDLAMVHENHHMKRALKKGKPYEFKWNKMMSKEQRESYYHNWADYFP